MKRKSKFILALVLMLVFSTVVLQQERLTSQLLMTTSK